MQHLHVIVFIAALAVCKAKSNCPQGWTIIEEYSGPELYTHLEPLIIAQRQKFENLYPGYTTKTHRFHEPMGQTTEEFSKSCNIDYLLQFGETDADNFNVSNLNLNEQTANYWQVSTERKCNADWNTVFDTWFDSIDFDQYDDEHMCQLAQVNADACSYNCFEATLEGSSEDMDDGKTVYINSFNCLYGINCDYTEVYESEKCQDVCGN